MRNREPFVAAARVVSGGVRALEHLVRALPAWSGLALIVVVDAPIRDVFQPVPLVEAAAAMPIRPGRIYWVRPGRPLRLQHQSFRVAERTGRGDHCNELLLSIAQEQRERAAAVLIPAINPAPYARGLNAIRASGGLTFGSLHTRRCKSPNLLDFELPPEEIAAALGCLASAGPPASQLGNRNGGEENDIESAATGRALFLGAPEAIIAIRNDGRIIAANPPARRMFGREAAELAGQPFEILFPQKAQAEYRSAWDACFNSLRRSTAGRTIERTASRKDGTLFSVEIRLSRILTGHGPIAMAFMTDISQRRRAEEEIRRSREELRALNSRLITVQEESRKHLARELHDGLTQQVATISVGVSRLRRSVAKPSREFNCVLAQVTKSINTLASDIHNFARGLHPSILDELGVIPALESECNFFEQQFGTRCRFVRGAGVPKRLPDQLGLTCYRIAQEAMRNAVQHASSRDILLTVHIRGDELVMTVVDHGRGFEVERVRRKGGLGLISMEERARQVNGTLAVISRPGTGTKIELRLPTRLR